MDLKEKVTDVLRSALDAERVQLEEDDGIYGFVVSSQFCHQTSLDRQKLIHRVLHRSASKLTNAELRRILAIAAFTPAEYAEHEQGEKAGQH